MGKKKQRDKYTSKGERVSVDRWHRKEYLRTRKPIDRMMAQMAAAKRGKKTYLNPDVMKLTGRYVMKRRSDAELDNIRAADNRVALLKAQNISVNTTTPL